MELKKNPIAAALSQAAENMEQKRERDVFGPGVADILAPATDSEIEQRLESLNPTGPRLTSDLIQAVIVDETYTRLEGTNITVCQLELANGYRVLGKNMGPVSAANFDQQAGCQKAYRDAESQVWQLEGYLLAQRLFEMKNPVDTGAAAAAASAGANETIDCIEFRELFHAAANTPFATIGGPGMPTFEKMVSYINAWAAQRAKAEQDAPDVTMPLGAEWNDGLSYTAKLPTIENQIDASISINSERADLAEAALLKNGFVKIDDVWVAPPGTPVPFVPQHPDEAAVDRFAAAIKAELAFQRTRGKGGWETCDANKLRAGVRRHTNPVKAGAYLMMLHARNDSAGGSMHGADRGDIQRVEAALAETGQELGKDAWARIRAGITACGQISFHPADTHVANPTRIQAREILRVEDVGGHVVLHLTDGTAYTATAEMMARMTPTAGDFLVRQADGYEYMNPRAVFMQKYRPL